MSQQVLHGNPCQGCHHVYRIENHRTMRVGCTEGWDVSNRGGDVSRGLPSRHVHGSYMVYGFGTKWVNSSQRRNWNGGWGARENCLSGNSQETFLQCIMGIPQLRKRLTNFRPRLDCSLLSRSTTRDPAPRQRRCSSTGLFETLIPTAPARRTTPWLSKLLSWEAVHAPEKGKNEYCMCITSSLA